MPKTAAVGGIEGGVNSSASSDGIPVPSKTKREAESLAENSIPFSRVISPPSEHGWRFDFPARRQDRKSQPRSSVPGIYLSRTFSHRESTSPRRLASRAKTQQSKCNPYISASPARATRFTGYAVALSP